MGDIAGQLWGIGVQPVRNNGHIAVHRVLRLCGHLFAVANLFLGCFWLHHTQ